MSTTTPRKLTTSAMIASFADPGSGPQAPFGHALARLAEERPEIVGLSADLAKYTDMHVFRDAHPDRFFQMGMAEQVMLGAAAGMAEVGLVPFASTYAVFATRRAYDFLCLDIAEPDLNVNVVGGLPGLTTGYGPEPPGHRGPRHHARHADLTIVDPCDSVDIEQAVPALAAAPGPTYMRLLRGTVPTVLDEYDYRFELGKAAELRTGPGRGHDLDGPHDDARPGCCQAARGRPRRRRRVARADDQAARPRGDPARGRAGPPGRDPREPHRRRRARRGGRLVPGLRRPGPVSCP